MTEAGHETHPSSRELVRLICAAVVSETFAKQLLTNPAAALRTGYLDEKFELPPEEQAIILAHQAKTLPELAQHLLGLN